jgi:protein-tyrosine-phosphatase
VHLKVDTALTRDDIEARTRALLPFGPVLVQSFTPGIGVGQEFLARDGQVLAVFQHERVHEPPTGGGSSYRRSVPVSAPMLAHSRRMLEFMRWTGVAMVEYKQDRSGAHFHLMEINGRFWGSLPLAVAAGADFPAWLYRMLVKGERPPAGTSRVGLHSRNLQKDVEWFAQNWRASRDDRLLITVPRGQPLWELRHLVAGRERWDTLTFDDWRPGVAEATQLAATLFRRVRAKARHRLLGLLATSALGRERQAARVRALVATTPRLLFMCKGNVCRSPFAEAYARKLLGHRPTELELVSGGVHPQAGRRVPEAAASAAREWGIDLEGHRSQRLSIDVVARAGAIFCMDLENHDALMAEFPELRGRVFLLRAFDHLEPGTTIRDPWGESLDTFRECYRTIARSIQGLLMGALALPEPPAVRPAAEPLTRGRAAG